jgi:hypothetical protein
MLIIFFINIVIFLLNPNLEGRSTNSYFPQHHHAHILKNFRMDMS